MFLKHDETSVWEIRFISRRKIKGLQHVEDDRNVKMIIFLDGVGFRFRSCSLSSY